jgi:hypothetical protein|tara:strand:+ start:860 stop:1018 length:159 start_codon:yes stop_codon:yes gene_type:complete
LAEGIGGKEKSIRDVCLDGGKNNRMACQAGADYQNHAIGWLQRDTIPLAVGQ